MRSLRPTFCFAALALAAGACATDTGILIEITDLDLAKAAGGKNLHVFVGSDVGERDASLVADTGLEPIGLDGAATVTILLRAAGGLDEIGALQFAAAVTSDAADANEIAFAAAAARVAFADGELRRVTLAPLPHHFTVTGPGQACVLWATDPTGPFDRAIGLRGDADCDAALNDVDCKPFDPLSTITHPVGDPAACSACATPDDPERCDGIDQRCDGVGPPPLPCAVIEGSGGCALGLRTCADSAGLYGNCMTTGVLPTRDHPLCDLLVGLDACVAAQDPLGCLAQNEVVCRVAQPAPGCPVERLPFTLRPAESCDWRIVGGVDQDQWMIGFDEPNTPGVPSARSMSCAPTLFARIRDPNADPSERSVLITGSFDGLALQFAVVTFKEGGECNGQIECDGPLFGAVAMPRQPAPAAPAPASPAPTISGSIIAAPVPSP